MDVWGDNVVFSAARDIRERMASTLAFAQKSLIEVRTVQAKEGQGSEELHVQTLKTVLQDAATLGGMKYDKNIQAVQELISDISKEGQFALKVRAVVDQGAWLNFSAKSGDYEHYQTAATIEVKELGDLVLQCEKEGGMKTRFGRNTAKLASYVLVLRKALLVALPVAEVYTQR